MELVFFCHDLSVHLFLEVLTNSQIILEFGTFLQARTPKKTDFTKLETWFGKILDHHNRAVLKEKEAQMLLYPCYIFDHAHGFAQVTKQLVYCATGHITEFNPTEHDHLHLDGNMTGMSAMTFIS